MLGVLEFCFLVDGEREREREGERIFFWGAAFHHAKKKLLKVNVRTEPGPREPGGEYDDSFYTWIQNSNVNGDYEIEYDYMNNN